MADFYGKMKAEREKRSPTYKILQADLVRASEKERAGTVASYVATAEEAFRLAGHEGFSYKGLDLRGKVGVVCYKGIEVMLLFKREVVEITPAPMDPVPERTLTEPADAWIQVNLLTVKEDARQKGVEGKLRSSIESVKRLEALWLDEKKRREEQEGKLTQAEEDRKAVLQLRVEVDVLKTSERIASEGIERVTAQLASEKRQRTEDQLRLVRELFPVFNTLWMAGEHRVGDSLYEILRKQLTEALGKVGAELVEPKCGDEFDPQLHHAVHSFPYQKGAEEIGTVVKVHRVGWKLINGQLVEAADVGVGVEVEESGE